MSKIQMHSLQIRAKALLELKGRKGVVTEEKYSSLKAQKVFYVEYHKATGWDFSDLDQLSKDQAKQFLEIFYQLQKFEEDNDTGKPIREVVFLHNKENPEWPKSFGDIARSFYSRPIYGISLTLKILKFLEQNPELWQHLTRSRNHL